MDRAVHAVDGKGLRALQMLVVSLLILGDVSWAVYNRILAKHNDDVSYVAHVTGAVMGLLVGFLALRNRHVERWEIVTKVKV